ncbi:unnamed protein product [Acanthoscelides obtectus]|uniref:Uncharacterized protein n=1 Tax=Acanthoscelides obtectus TaxID=200917 RepID=A0A9P0KX27_ACAOB|nr:unnamed protein product [Acanthoscelides obtectus]CAK1653956.1 hypothetical protein AOBTE_LOCUS18406 [Acanthoscelides obtectus]
MQSDRDFEVIFILSVFRGAMIICETCGSGIMYVITSKPI